MSKTPSSHGPQGSPGPARGDGAKEGEQGGAARPAPKHEVVEPIGKRVLIRKDEDRKTTKTGIHLPDKIEIPTITGRIVAISRQVEKDDDYPLRRYDRILFNPKHAIPVEFDGDNRLFVLPIEDVVAVFRKAEDAAD